MGRPPPAVVDIWRVLLVADDIDSRLVVESGANDAAGGAAAASSIRSSSAPTIVAAAEVEAEQQVYVPQLWYLLAW